jgi:hypothetical protein
MSNPNTEAEASSNQYAGPYYLPLDLRAIPSTSIILPMDKVDKVMNFNLIAYILTNIGTFVADIILGIGIVIFIVGLASYIYYVHYSFYKWKKEAVPLKTPQDFTHVRTSNQPAGWVI